jgi:hypothetical protein
VTRFSNWFEWLGTFQKKESDNVGGRCLPAIHFMMIYLKMAKYECKRYVFTCICSYCSYVQTNRSVTDACKIECKSSLARGLQRQEGISASKNANLPHNSAQLWICESLSEKCCQCILCYKGNMSYFVPNSFFQSSISL